MLIGGLKCAVTDFPHSAYESPHQLCSHSQVTHFFPRNDVDWINVLRAQMSQTDTFEDCLLSERRRSK